MFKHLRSLGWFMLLVSMNLLSMDCYNKLVSEKESVELPLLTPRVEQKIVSLRAGSEKGYPLLFDQSQKSGITHYLLDGVPIAQLFQLNDTMHFESKNSYKYDFLLQNSLKASSLVISAQGNFAFQKPVSTNSAYLVCNSVQFLNKFSSKNDLTLDVDCCDNLSDVKCTNIFFRGNRFNLKADSSLTIRGIAALSSTQELINNGAIFCGHNSLINTRLFENEGTLEVNNLCFDSGKVLNKGRIQIGGSLSGACESFDHRGGLNVQDNCIFEKIGTLSTARFSWWHVGRDWKVPAEQVCLDGYATAGNSALLTVDLHAIVNGFLRAPVIAIESKDRITCAVVSQLTASHHIGLKAQGLIQVFGEILRTSLIPGKALTNVATANEPFAPGVFLHSEQSSLQKFGKIFAEQGVVDLKAEKEVMVGGLTETQGSSGVNFVVRAQDIKLEESSRIISSDASLKADKTIHNKGDVSLSGNLLAHAKSVKNSGAIAADSAHIKADRFWWNEATGTVKINNGLVVDALASFNTLGLIQANDFTVNAGLDWSFLGICRTKNKNINALSCFNAGLVIPKFDSLSELQSPDNAWKVGEYFFTKFLPIPALIYSFAKNVNEVCAQSRALGAQLYNLYTQKDVGASDVVSLLSGTKNLIKSAMQMKSMGQSGYRSVCSASNANVSSAHSSNSEIPVPIDWKDSILKTTSDVASIVGPQYNSDTLFDSNCGVILGVNGHSNSVYDSNDGISLFANKYSLDTRNSTNHGILGASNLAVNATKRYHTNGTIGALTSSISGETLFLDGKIGVAGSAAFKACSRAFIDGKINADQIAVQSDNSIHVGLHGNLRCSNAQLTAERTIYHSGVIQADKGLSIEAWDMRHHGSSQAQNLCIKGGSFNASESSHITAENGLIQADHHIVNAGTITMQQIGMESRRIKLDNTSSITAESAYLKADGWRNDGTLVCDHGSFEVENKLSNAGTIKVEKQFQINNPKEVIFERTSVIDVANANIRVSEAFKNEGKFNVEQDFFLRAKYGENLGSITAGRASIKMDRYMYEGAGSSLKAREWITIDAPLVVNFFGRVEAKSVTVNAGIDLNLFGVYRAHDLVMNSLVGYNIGLLIPQFDYWQDLLTKKNAVMLAEALFVRFVPIAGKVYSLTKNIPSMYRRGSVLLKQIKKLHEHRGEVGASDVISVLCATKNLVIPVAQAVGQTYQVAQDGYQIAQDGCLIAQNNYQRDWGATALETVSAAASLFGPQITRHSLIDCNAGVMLGMNGSSKSLYNAQSGASLFANNNSIETVHGYNSGFLGGVNLSVNASQAYTNASAGRIYAGSAVMTAHDLDISGDVCAINSAILKAYNKATIDSNVSAKKVSLQAKNAELKSNTHLVANNAYVKVSENVHNDGCVEVKNLHVEAKNITTSELSRVAIQNGEFKAEERIVNAGSLAVSEQLVATAKNILLEETSSLDLNRAHVKVSENVHNDGCVDAKNLHVEAKNITTSELSRVTTENGEFKAEERIVNAGALVVSQELVATAKNILLEKTSCVDLSSAYVKASESINNKGSIDVSQVLFAQAKCIENSGKIAGDKLIAVQATERIDLKEESCISGKSIFVQAPSVYGQEGNVIASQENYASIKTSFLNNKGTVDGGLALQFDGNESGLQSIGHVDKFAYFGTVHNGLADQFADGNNDLLHVQEGGSVVVFADQQDVHVKDEHHMAHAFEVHTQGSVVADKELTSDKFIILDARQNVEHSTLKAKEKIGIRAGKNVIAASKVERVYDGENYEDKIEQVVVASELVNIHAADNVHYNAVKVDSHSNKSSITADGKLIADVVVLEKYTKTESEPVSKYFTTTTTTTEDICKTIVHCEFSTDSQQTISTGDTGELSGTILTGATVLNAPKGLVSIPVCDTHRQVISHKYTGLKKGESFTKTYSEAEKPVQFVGGKAPVINSDEKVSLAFTCDAPEISINAPEVECLAAKETKTTCSAKDVTYLFAWQSGKTNLLHNVTYAPSYGGAVRTNAERLLIEGIKGHTPIPVINSNDKGMLTRVMLEDVHNHQKLYSYNRPTKEFMLVVAMATSMLTSGLGASAGAALATKVGCESAWSAAMITNMAATAVMSSSVRVAEVLLHCNGDAAQAARQLASLESVKNLMRSIVTAGATSGVGHVFTKIGLRPVNQARSFRQRLACTFPRQAAQASTRIVIDALAGGNIKKSAAYNFKVAACNTLGIAGSSQIGDMYGKGKIGFVGHKGLHALLGATQGAIVGGKSGVVAGGLGALVCETVADVCVPKAPSIECIQEIALELGRPLTQLEFTHAWNCQTHAYLQNSYFVANMSKLTAACAALVTHQDVDIAASTAAIAVDNNFLVLAGYGIAAASTAYSAYEVYNAFQENGAQAGFEKLGIEVVHNVAGYAAGHVAFKCGGAMYPSARAAVLAVLDAHPGLGIALGGLTEKLVIAGEKLAQTFVGKQVGLLCENVACVEAQLIKAEQKVVQKIGNKLGSCTDDLVEQVVPGKVLRKVESTVVQRLKPLGRGNTGRAIPQNFYEQLVLEEIMADPSLGRELGIKKGMTDVRWHQDDGWTKMFWHDHDHDIEIHFVVQKIDGIIKAIDDFKFKK